FTIVTAAAAIERNLSDFIVPPTSSFPANPNFPAISNLDGNKCGGTIKSLMLDRCRSGWATIGKEIGQEALEDVTKRFGLIGNEPLQSENALPGPVTSARLASSVPHAAVGTSLKLTPLQVANLFATIGNSGSQIEPRLVDRVRAHDGSVIHEFEPQILNQSVSKETAAQLLELLSENVISGSAAGIALSDVSIGGLLASSFSQSQHLWMVALAPVTRPEVIVAVLLEGDDFDDQQTAEASITGISRRITEAVIRLPSPTLGGS
ncbi:MAG TPA: hypothetical protein DCL16_10200, partial [Acidimicrobiaceae bacterium]|nr:hypothetical protein [Acidimicrobiaceae bacterium]